MSAFHLNTKNTFYIKEKAAFKLQRPEQIINQIIGMERAAQMSGKTILRLVLNNAMWKKLLILAKAADRSPLAYLNNVIREDYEIFCQR